MSDDPIMVLERELVQAARRQNSLARSHAPARRGRFRPAPDLSAIGVAALLVVALVIALGALLLGRVHHGQRPSGQPSAPTHAAQSRERLVSVLGVLRRPQTHADLAVPGLRGWTRDPLFALRGTPDLPLVRLAATTPWGERIYFVPLVPPPAAELRALTRRARMPLRYGERLRARGETLGVLSAAAAGAGISAQDVEAGRSWFSSGPGRFAGGATASRLVVIVPDGVARVAFALRSSGTRSTATTAVATVHGNVAAIQIDRACCERGAPMIWYDASGHVVKRIGYFKDTVR